MYVLGKGEVAMGRDGLEGEAGIEASTFWVTAVVGLAHGCVKSMLFSQGLP